MHHQESEAKTNENTDGARGLRPRMLAKTYEENYFSTLFFRNKRSKIDRGE